MFKKLAAKAKELTTKFNEFDDKVSEQWDDQCDQLIDKMGNVIMVRAKQSKNWVSTRFPKEKNNDVQ